MNIGKRRLADIARTMEQACDAGTTMLLVTRRGDGLAFGGDHIASGFCWCQPPVRAIPTGHGHDHFIALHREFSDMPDSADWAEAMGDMPMPDLIGDAATG